jgi:hypothetical protein
MAAIAASIVGGWLFDKIFESGGKVPGKGPKLAVVHGGEVVLNKAQQKSISSAKTAKGAAAALKKVQQKKKAKPSKAAAHKAIKQAIKGKKKKR